MLETNTRSILLILLDAYHGELLQFDLLPIYLRLLDVHVMCFHCSCSDYLAGVLAIVVFGHMCYATKCDCLFNGILSPLIAEMSV